jgi:exonuclease VII large subunit
MTYVNKSKAQGKQKQQQQQQLQQSLLLKKQSRERNRLHARQTRLRKKARMEILREQVRELQAQGQELRQTLEDCRTAFILAGLSGTSGDTAVSVSSHIQSLLIGTDLPGVSMLSSSLSVEHCDDDEEEEEEVEEEEEDDDKEDENIGTQPNRLCKRKKLAQPLTLVVHGGQTIQFGVGHCHLNWKTGVYYQSSMGIGKSCQLTREQLETLRYVCNKCFCHVVQ